MNYYKIYDSLMSSRQTLNRKSNKDGMLERHHILPKSLGGTNDKNNLVYLTPREHFIAHLLLTKIHGGKDKAKMIFAFAKMCQCNPNQKRTVNSRYFEMSKRLMSLHCSGENSSFYGKTHSNETKKRFSEQKKGANNPMFGKPAPNRGITPAPLSNEAKHRISVAHKGKITSDETKLKMSIAAKGKPKSEEHKKNLSKINKGKTFEEIHGAEFAAEIKQKLSAVHKGKKQKELTCPHCNKAGRGNSMIRWHFDNCRFLP